MPIIVTEDQYDVYGTSLYEYRDELIVEITAQDREHDGEFVAIAYQFEYDQDGQGVTPKEPIDETFEPEVRATLDEEGYRLLADNSGH